MKIVKAHRTRSSYFLSANTNGASMHPSPIVTADLTRKKIRKNDLNINWRTLSGQHCLLADGDIGAPIYIFYSIELTIMLVSLNYLCYN
jgi:hypothetical protein